MTVYTPPVADTQFALEAVADLYRYSGHTGFQDATPDMVAAILTEAGRFAADVFHPLNAIGDRTGCTRHGDGSVTTPPGFREAYARFCSAGWGGLSADPQFGGQGLPHVLAVAANEYMSSANMALAMYPGLTAGAIAAIETHGTPQQKADYLAPMIAGTWTGTMNLTEPHCGTDLGLLRCRATPQADGSHAISGQKIFISAGEHDLSDNIVHLVLARIDGAPAGVRGISLFIVPKLYADGTRNALSCGAIEEKMGIHGNATCVMNYDGATGWLLGEAHRGLAAMFTMMNEARLGVGVQGLAVSEIAYQNAVAYARERLQGRGLPSPAFPDRPADPIIVHPDIRRMLMTMRAINEAGRALVLHTALSADLARHAKDAQERAEALDHLGLMTPVIKGVLTDLGFDNAVMAQQVLGGHGYIAEWGMEQFVRDARIAQIYEGANGIQALDLVGRKLGLDGGRAVSRYFASVAAFCDELAGDPALSAIGKGLARGFQDLRQATAWLAAKGAEDPNHGAAGASDYMHLFGLVALGMSSARMAAAAQARLAAGAPQDAAFLQAKLATARFFMERLMPETAMRLGRITAGAGSIMALDADAF